MSDSEELDQLFGDSGSENAQESGLSQSELLKDEHAVSEEASEEESISDNEEETPLNLLELKKITKPSEAGFIVRLVLLNDFCAD